MSGAFQVRLPVADYGAQGLTSRSQAHSVLRDIRRSRDVVLDFAGVKQIGSEFADEIFHVYAEKHPAVHLAYMNVTPGVRRAIKNAVACRREDAHGQTHA